MDYRAVFFGVLLYGVETWVNKSATTWRLKSFNSKFLRRMLGITRAQQCKYNLTSVQVRRRFGAEEALEDVVTAKRLRWVGHIARMDDSHLPKKPLLEWLPKQRPAHGTKQRWRDEVRKDMSSLESRWETGSMWHRTEIKWRGICKEGLTARIEEWLRMERSRCDGSPSITAPRLVCNMCRLSFWRMQQIICQIKVPETLPRGYVDYLPRAV